MKYTRKIIEAPEGAQLLKIKRKVKKFCGDVGKEPSLGGKPRGARTLERRIVTVEINRSVVAVGGGYTGRDIMSDGGGERETIRERHRILRRVQVLGGKRWGRGRIFIASPRVWDDRELMRKLSGFCVGRKHRREELVSFGGVGWRVNMAEKDVGGREMMECDMHSAEKIFFGRQPVLGRCRSGSKKYVRTRKIVVWQRREAEIK